MVENPIQEATDEVQQAAPITTKKLKIYDWEPSAQFYFLFLIVNCSHNVLYMFFFSLLRQF